MTFQSLDVIKSRTLLLTVGEPSPEILLVDPDGGDIYFVFELLYAQPGSRGVTRLLPRDPFHAKIEIEITRNSLVEPSEPIPVGTYGAHHLPLYVGFAVSPQYNGTEKHDVTVTFYVRKEVGL